MEPRLDYLIGAPGQSGYVLIVRGWIAPDEANKYFDWYQSNINWTRSEVFVHGKTHVSPRLTCFVGDDNVGTYAYNVKANKVGHWDQMSVLFRDRVLQETGVYLDCGLLNYYRDGADYIAYHSDKQTKSIGNTIVGISLGSTRRFYFKDRNSNSTIKTTINSGDCMVMYGDIQEKYKHTVPKQQGVGPRISITLRNISGQRL